MNKITRKRPNYFKICFISEISKYSLRYYIKQKMSLSEYIYNYKGDKIINYTEDKKINELNIKKFKRYDLFCNDKIYYCCLCEEKVDLSSSWSNNGDRLVCANCYYNKLGGIGKARKWINREV